MSNVDPAPEWKTRLIVGRYPDRSFDIEFRQQQGDEAIFSASEPRFTKGLDIRVGHSAASSRRVCTALARFGAPVRQDGVDESTFAAGNTVYQIGIAPVRVDVLTSISG